jgi:guanosine-3',5'-bis(diphosphate) 3'-pyrophosphohydrolase
MVTSCEDLLSQVLSFDQNANVDLIRKAYDYAVKYHGSQVRESGDPYYQHPIEVAKIIADMKLDVGTIVAAILHDTIEDTTLTLEEIEKEFGQEVSRLVNGVTKLTKIEFQPDYVRQAENFRKLLLAMSDDIRVLIIKLADRLHNMRTIDFVTSPEKRHRISVETMEIYAPLAERMGMQEIKLELHDVAFKVLHPAIYFSIIDRLNEVAHNEQELVDNIIQALMVTMTQLDIKCEIYGRRKTPFSIWMKMKHKNVGFDQLADIVAFRIIVDNLLECYRVLGAVHSSFQMIPDQFQDFISTPKNNGYQSLHTVIIGPKQQRIEIQIRTEEMHEIAEWGIAAHWSYKQKQKLAEAEGKQYKWIKDLLEILEQSNDPEEFLKSTKMAMHYDHVFCFTPKGELIALPLNATPIDFAYMVHSDVGNRCVGALVNGKIAPLKTTLKNGDQVEIITSITGKPSPSWESFVVTGKARSEVRKFVRSQRKEEFVTIGKNILEKESKINHFELDKINIKKLLKRFGRNNIEDVYFGIGDGSIQKSQLTEAIIGSVKKIGQLHSKDKDIPTLYSKKPKKNDNDNPLTESADGIEGLIPGMLSHFAGCCYPIFGDKIVGIIHTATGVTIHKTDCSNAKKISHEKERIVELGWSNKKQNISCIGRLRIVVTNEVGSLAFVTTIMAQAGVDITNFRIVNRNQDFFEILVDVCVSNQSELDSITNSLRSGKFVTSAERSKA